MRNLRKKVNRVRISGGIGNQLFMYVAGKALAQRHAVNLEVYRKSSDKAENLHPGDLTEFNISLLTEIEELEDRAESLLSRLQRFGTRKFYKLTKPFIKYFGYFESSDIGYDPRLYSLSPGVEIRGYFQTYKYFDDCLLQLRSNELISLGNPSPDFLTLSQYFERFKVCAIHIRRGDYMHHQESIGLMGTGYYSQAVEKVLKNRIVERFAVFSDDPEAAYGMLKNELPSETMWPKDFESLSAAENLMLMSGADSLIIANSTFSLFASLLASEESLIIRPNRWFMGQDDPIDLFRPHWIAVDG